MSNPLSAPSGALARVVFDTFRSADDPMLAAWLAFRARALPAASAPPLPSVRTQDAPGKRGMFGVWRLLATNNRELARGSSLHESPDSAWAEAEGLRARFAELTPSVMRGSAAMRHGWALRLSGDPVLICSRWYESPGEANAAARAARDSLGRSTIVRAFNIGTRSGRRHRQTGPAVQLVD